MTPGRSAAGSKGKSAAVAITADIEPDPEPEPTGPRVIRQQPRRQPRSQRK